MHCSGTLWHHPDNLMWFGLRPHGFDAFPMNKSDWLISPVTIGNAQKKEDSSHLSKAIMNNVILLLISCFFSPPSLFHLTDFSRARRWTALQLQSELINNYLRRHTNTDSGCSSRPAVAVETTAAVLRAEIGRWRGKNEWRGVRKWARGKQFRWDR